MHNKVLDTVLKALEPYTGDFIQSIVLVGSLAWNTNIDKDSDIDLEIYIDHSQQQNISNKELGILYDLENYFLFKDASIDYLSTKIYIDKIKVSLHFTPLIQLQKYSQIDLINIKNTVHMREFRMQKKDKEPIYTQYNFSGDNVHFSIPITNTTTGLICETPFAIINRNRLHLGIIQDKLLSGKVIFGTSNFTTFYSELIKNIYERCIYEEKIVINCDIVKALNRSGDIPSEYLDRIREKYENYKSSKK